MELKGVYSSPNGEIPIKGTPDTMFLEDHHIDDTKTVSVKGNGKFENACRYNIEDYDYIFSMSFYAVLYCLKYGELPKKLTLSFIGTNSGHKFLQYEIPTDVWHPMVGVIRNILDFYGECLEKDNWPTYSEMEGNQGDIFRHLRCEHYDLNPGAIQKEAIPFFTDL